MNIIRKRAYARAGLVGNPSDGFGGRTISFTMTNFHAEVVMYPWDQIEILWSQQDKNRFDTVDQLVADVKYNGYYGGVRFVKGTIKRFVEFCRAQAEPEFHLHDTPFSVRYDTNIPRGVGLSGSSAIVVATLRCLMEFYDIRIRPEILASLARSVESEELGIACGYQDRVAQVYDGLVAMNFDPLLMQANCERGYEFGEYHTIDTSRLPPLYLAYNLGAAKVSHTVHAPLQQKLKQDKDLQATMHSIAELVPAAEAAILSGDHAALHEILNRNFDLRKSLYNIRPDHQHMIDVARRVGCSAKFAGSGGAIVGTFSDILSFQSLQSELARISVEFLVVRPTIVCGQLE
jgi:glucuronokinase